MRKANKCKNPTNDPRAFKVSKTKKLAAKNKYNGIPTNLGLKHPFRSAPPFGDTTLGATLASDTVYVSAECST